MTGRESLFEFLKQLRIQAVFAWYDLWIGVYYDRQKRWLYVLPLPCVGLVIKFRPRDVTLLVAECGNSKIAAIKEIRAVTRLGLREAKDATEGAGLKLAYDVGMPLADTLRDLGVRVEVTNG